MEGDGMTIQELARAATMERATRADGTKFVKFTDDAPEWCTDMAHQAHGDMLPEDWRYSFIEGSLDAIADTDDYDDARERATEPDIYTHDLLAWLASRTDRYGYADEYREGFGPDTDFLGSISGGQWLEKCEVFDAVWFYLEEMVS